MSQESDIVIKLFFDVEALKCDVMTGAGADVLCVTVSGKCNLTNWVKVVQWKLKVNNNSTSFSASLKLVFKKLLNV